MGFVCSNPKDLVDKIRNILSDCGHRYHPGNAKLILDTEYGPRILFQKGWICSRLKEYNMDKQFVDRRVLDLLPFCSNDFYVHQDGIQFRQLLAVSPDELTVIDQVAGALQDGGLALTNIMDRIPETTTSGRFRNSVAVLRFFVDFHDDKFVYKSSDIIGLHPDFKLKQEAMDDIHETMRGYGSGKDRMMSSKALFEVWSGSAFNTEAQMVDALKQCPKFKVDPSSGDVSLVLPGNCVEKTGPKSKRETVTLDEVKADIEQQIIGNKGQKTLKAILISISEKSKLVIVDIPGLKCVINLYCDTFKFVNSSVVGLKEQTATLQASNDMELSRIVEQSLRNFGQGKLQMMPIKTLWTDLSLRNEATFATVKELRDFLQVHRGTFNVSQSQVGLTKANSSPSGSIKSDQSSVKSNTHRLEGNQVDELVSLLKSGKHTMDNSALAYFEFKNKEKQRENKVYFKAAWVVSRMKFKTGNPKEFARNLDKHHRNKFAVFHSQLGQRDSLIQLRETLDRLPTEEAAVDELKAIFSKRSKGRNRMKREDIYDAASNSLKLRFNLSMLCVTNFVHFHKDEFDIDSEGYIQLKFSESLNDSKSNSTLKKCLTPGQLQHLENFLKSAKHTTENSNLGVFEFNKPEAERRRNKVYFKAAWVKTKLNFQQFANGHQLAEALMKHHSRTFAVNHPRGLIHVRDMFDALMAEEDAVDELKAIFKTTKEAGYRMKEEDIYDAASNSLKLRFNLSKLCVTNFVHFHKDEFDIDSEGYIRMKFSDSLNDSKSNSTSKKCLTPGQLQHLENFLKSAKHTTENSNLGVFEFNKPEAERRRNKVYFKAAWVKTKAGF